MNKKSFNAATGTIKAPKIKTTTLRLGLKSLPIALSFALAALVMNSCDKGFIDDGGQGTPLIRNCNCNCPDTIDHDMPNADDVAPGGCPCGQSCGGEEGKGCDCQPGSGKTTQPDNSNLDKEDHGDQGETSMLKLGDYSQFGTFVVFNGRQYA